MATHTADLVTFLTKLTGTVAVSSYETTPNEDMIGGNQRAHISAPEIYEVKEVIPRITYMYPVKLRGGTAANLETLMTALIGNIRKVKFKIAIATYTTPVTLAHMTLYNSGQMVPDMQNDDYTQEVKILMEWNE